MSAIGGKGARELEDEDFEKLRPGCGVHELYEVGEVPRWMQGMAG
jgi:hypothetical protein